MVFPSLLEIAAPQRLLKTEPVFLRRRSCCFLFGTFNEATLVGNNTFGYLVTVVLRETLTSEKEKASLILCSDQRNPAVVDGDNLF